MNPERMRQAILAAYPGQHWLSDVKKMSDQQIYLVYLRLVSARKPKEKK